jgi:hypothetical protein
LAVKLMNGAPNTPTHGGKADEWGTRITGWREAVRGDGQGTGDGAEQLCTEGECDGDSETKGSFSYIATLLYGSLAAVDVGAVDLKAATAEVMQSNRMKAAAERIQFAGGGERIKHVIYIIKENRTYDQVFGDLKQNGRPVGNGDAGLAMYGESVTPNQHKLALQFGVLDNFFDSGEVSGDGHVWSNAAISSDYNEKTWQQEYRNAQRTYDYEGVVSNGYPLLQKIADVNEPASGYMWGNAEAHGRTHYNFGEYISSTFCDAKKSGSSQEGPLLEGPKCAREAIQHGRGDSGGVGRGSEPVAVGDSAAGGAMWRPSRSWWDTLRRSRRTSTCGFRTRFGRRCFCGTSRDG